MALNGDGYVGDKAIPIRHNTSNQTWPKLIGGVTANCARHRHNFLKAMLTFVELKFWVGEIIEIVQTICVHPISVFFFSNIWLHFVSVLIQTIYKYVTLSCIFF